MSPAPSCVVLQNGCNERPSFDLTTSSYDGGIELQTRGSWVRILPGAPENQRVAGMQPFFIPDIDGFVPLVLSVDTLTKPSRSAYGARCSATGARSAAPSRGFPTRPIPAAQTAAYRFARASWPACVVHVNPRRIRRRVHEDRHVPRALSRCQSWRRVRGPVHPIARQEALGRPGVRRFDAREDRI
jgi:hypothetical protein